VGSQAALRALAEPRRQEMLILIRDQARSVNEIAQRFDITQQAVSQHLQVLAGAGLVRVQQDGRRRLYELDPTGLADLESFLASLWPRSLARLKTVVEEDHGR
jgi:DNA-binding transcriptional ArsR family regulator